MLVGKIVPLRYILSQARIEIVRQGRAYVTLLVCLYSSFSILFPIAMQTCARACAYQS